MITPPSKHDSLAAFRDHVSSGKVAFWQGVGMDFVMGRREGCWMWDMEGAKKLFNLHVNGGVYNLGHRNLEVIATLKEAVGEVDIGNGHLVSWARAALGEKLAASMPGDLDYVVFGVGGGEAVDLAIKVARGHTGRTRIISARGGYHGHTGLALATGDEKYRKPFGPQLPGFVQVPFGDIEALSAQLDGDTAAVILETVPATLGMPLPPPGYLTEVRERCDRAGALLILDEVQTGLGRTGKLWAFEHFDVLPDLVVVGKGLSGGIYPITATVMRRPLEAIFHADPHIHVSTFGGSELGCVVALKVLEISSAPGFLRHVDEMAAVFRDGVREVAQRHPVIEELRQLGLFMGVKTRSPALGPLLCGAAYQQDLFMVYANNDTSVCQFLPPLVIQADEARWVLERLERAVAMLEAAVQPA